MPSIMQIIDLVLGCGVFFLLSSLEVLGVLLSELVFIKDLFEIANSAACPDVQSAAILEEWKVVNITPSFKSLQWSLGHQQEKEFNY